MTKTNEALISGLNKNVLENRVFDLDGVLGGVMLNSMTYENISIELGRIAEKVDNTDQSNMTMMALTLRDIAHSIGLLSDLMNYTTNEFSENVKQFSDLCAGLSSDVRKMESKKIQHSLTSMKPMSIEREKETKKSLTSRQ